MSMNTTLLLTLGAPSLILIIYTIIVPLIKALKLHMIIPLIIMWCVWKFPSLAVVYTLSKMAEKKPTETILLLGGASYLKRDNVIKEKIEKYVEKNMREYE